MAHEQSSYSDVFVWYRNTTSLDSEALTAAGRYLSPDELDRRDRLYFENDRRDFTMAHDLLRRALSRFADISPADWRFVVDRRGKPLIERANSQELALSFSLAHTRGYVACAIGFTEPLGIDIEKCNHSARLQDIADRHFSADEVAWLRKSSDELRNNRFTELWTLKEAFLKAIGVGLSAPLSMVSFYFDRSADIGFSLPAAIEPGDWHFALFEPATDVRIGIAIGGVARPRFLVRVDEGDGDGNVLTPIRASSPSA